MFLGISADGFFPASRINMILTRTKTTQRLWRLWDFPTEEAMLKDFLEYFLKSEEKSIIGYDILKFDLPMMLMKSINLPAFNQLFKKLHEVNVTDLAVVLGFGEEGPKPLSEFMKNYGINGTAATHFDLIRLYQTHEYAHAEQEFTKRVEKIISLYEAALKKRLEMG